MPHVRPALGAMILSWLLLTGCESAGAADGRALEDLHASIKERMRERWPAASEDEKADWIALLDQIEATRRDMGAASQADVDAYLAGVREYERLLGEGATQAALDGQLRELAAIGERLGPGGANR